jgi:pyruvate/2-oxoglutarate dehydrogenase complex dihydrolipoamide acyltransferase (E2) component
MGELEFRLPKLSMTMVEAEIGGWHVAEGDAVSEGQDLVNILTDKVDNDLPSPATGVVGRIVVAVGDTVEVGDLLAVIETAS